MVGTRKRLARLVLAFGLTGAILAGPMGIGSAQAAELAAFEGTSTGYALRVTLDLKPLIQLVPALQGVLDTVWQALPGHSGQAFPGVIDQYLIKTTSDADSGSNVAKSVLAEGLLNLDSLEATSIGQTLEKTVQALNVPSDALPLINGTVGNLAASVLKGPSVAGKGALANLDVGLPLDILNAAGGGTLLSDLTTTLQNTIDGLTAQLAPVLSSVLGSAGGNLVGQLTGTITDLSTQLTGGQLTGLLGGLGLASSSDLSNPTAVSTALTDLLDPTALLDQITSLLNTNLLSGALASIEGLLNNTSAAQLDTGKAIADSVAQIKNLDVLGGLVNVGLFNLKSHSEAAGVKGSANNTSDCSIADVNIGGGALGISLDGKNVTINGTPVPVVGDLVGTVKGLVDQILGVLGVDVGLCETADVQVAPDGTSASQSVSALRVEVAPLGLFRLIIDPTVQTSVAAAPAVPNSPTQPDVSLPRTGPGMLATVLTGLSLAGGAFLVRKRLF